MCFRVRLGWRTGRPGRTTPVLFFRVTEGTCSVFTCCSPFEMMGLPDPKRPRPGPTAAAASAPSDGGGAAVAAARPAPDFGQRVSAQLVAGRGLVDIPATPRSREGSKSTRGKGSISSSSKGEDSFGSRSALLTLFTQPVLRCSPFGNPAAPLWVHCWTVDDGRWAVEDA